jgi:hypothetical protein
VGVIVALPLRQPGTTRRSWNGDFSGVLKAVYTWI